MIIVIFTKSKEFCLIRHKFYFVLLAVLCGEEKEILEVMDAVREKYGIISKRDTRNHGVTILLGVSVGNSELAQLGGDGLLVVVQLVLVRRGDSSLLQSCGVKYGPHQSLIEVAKCLPA